MLDKFLVSWILQRVFHALIGHLQLLMYTCWLSAKLSATMDIIFLAHLSIFSSFWDQRWKIKLPRICLECPKVRRSQPHLRFQLSDIEVLFIIFVDDFNTITFKWCHITLKDWDILFNNLNELFKAILYTQWLNKPLLIQIGFFCSQMCLCIFNLLKSNPFEPKWTLLFSNVRLNPQKIQIVFFATQMSICTLKSNEVFFNSNVPLYFQ